LAIGGYNLVGATASRPYEICVIAYIACFAYYGVKGLLAILLSN